MLAYIFYGSSCQANNYFGIYLSMFPPCDCLRGPDQPTEAMGYSVNKRNIIPATANLGTAVPIVLIEYTDAYQSALSLSSSMSVLPCPVFSN